MVFSTQAGGGMPEIGLLPFARVALDVAAAVLPTYRSRFNKHQFTQPQLLAILGSPSSRLPTATTLVGQMSGYD